MTETEWLGASEPRPMLDALKGKASDRKRRLCVAACCRRVWQLLDEDVLRPGVEVVERYADGLATARELEEAHRAARAQKKSFEKLCAWQRNTRGVSPKADSYQRESEQAYLVECASQMDDYLWPVLLFSTFCKIRGTTKIQPVQDQRENEEWARLRTADRAELADLLRDIFSPVHPIPLAPRWQTPTVLALARGIYTDRAFDRLPILADSLQDAGCENADLLEHCRSDKPHVRGCWVVDLVLGKI